MEGGRCEEEQEEEEESAEEEKEKRLKKKLEWREWRAGGRQRKRV